MFSVRPASRGLFHPTEGFNRPDSQQQSPDDLVVGDAPDGPVAAVDAGGPVVAQHKAAALGSLTVE